MTFTKMHSFESKFVTGPSNILFAGVYVCAFQSGKFTGRGSEGVNDAPDYLYNPPRQASLTELVF